MLLRAVTSEHGGLVMKAPEFARQVGTTCATRASCSAMKLTKGGAACGILVELVADEQRTHASNAVFMCAWPILSSFTKSKFCLCWVHLRTRCDLNRAYFHRACLPTKYLQCVCCHFQWGDTQLIMYSQFAASRRGAPPSSETCAGRGGLGGVGNGKVQSNVSKSFFRNRVAQQL